jgi:hypothetical protein
MAACWSTVLESKAHKLLSSIKESLARVYVLSTAKHLLEGLIDARESVELIKNKDPDMRTLCEVAERNLRCLTAFTVPVRPGHKERRESERSFFKAVPVPGLVSRYFRDVPFLAQTFVSLVRTNIRLLGESVGRQEDS